MTFFKCLLSHQILDRGFMGASWEALKHINLLFVCSHLSSSPMSRKVHRGCRKWPEKMKRKSIHIRQGRKEAPPCFRHVRCRCVQFFSPFLFLALKDIYKGPLRATTLAQFRLSLVPSHSSQLFSFSQENKFGCCNSDLFPRIFFFKRTFTRSDQAHQVWLLIT